MYNEKIYYNKKTATNSLASSFLQTNISSLSVIYYSNVKYFDAYVYYRKQLLIKLLNLKPKNVQLRCENNKMNISIICIRRPWSVIQKGRMLPKEMGQRTGKT